VMIYDNVLDAIGNTPLIRVNRLNSSNVPVYAKLESSNPGGSVKERISLSLIEAGEASGELSADKIVLEATSGNTGIGLAMVCAAKGYRCQLVMPESASLERRQIMQAYGAEILLTPAKRSTDGAIEKAYAMAREHPERYYLTINSITKLTGGLIMTTLHQKSGSRQMEGLPMWWQHLVHRALLWGSVSGLLNITPK